IGVLEEARVRWNRGDFEGYLRLYSFNAVLHGYANVLPGLRGIRQFYEGFWSAFPGSHIIFEDVFAADDRVACRFVIKATHAGEFQGLAATGKSIHLPGITILKFAEGRCVERWSQVDASSLLEASETGS
ncbi:MAG: ester cyclase, partial [Vicinamibacteraceae bacterium]